MILYTSWNAHERVQLVLACEIEGAVEEIAIVCARGRLLFSFCFGGRRFTNAVLRIEGRRAFA